ncbi:MAG TPA: hypothetical protein VF918_13970 [Anaerolineales bacterium]
MASSKLRTHQSKSIIDNEGSRSTITGLLQRDPTADELRRSSCSLQSVQLDGGVLTFVADNRLRVHVQPPSRSRTAAPERMISDNETEDEPSDAHGVNLDIARHNHRGSYEL